MNNREVIGDNGVFRLEAEVNPAGSVFLHVSVNKEKFSISALKQTLHNDWVEVLLDFKRVGIEELFTNTPIEDESALHLTEMFGFEPLIVTDSTVIYRRKV